MRIEEGAQDRNRQPLQPKPPANRRGNWGTLACSSSVTISELNGFTCCPQTSAVDSSAERRMGKSLALPHSATLDFATRRPSLLLDRGDDVLGSLGYAELHHGLGLDLDRRAGLRVAANAGLALSLDEAADARDDEYPILLGLLDGCLGECVEEGADLLVGELEFFRHETDEGCLGQSSCHSVFPPMFCACAHIRVAW